jgi:Uma2 family endonuclease
MSRVQEKIDDFLSFGVRYVWLINPEGRRAWIYTRDSISEVRDGVLRTENPEIVVPMSAVMG